MNLNLERSAPASAVCDQLYRYAADLQQVIERNGKLESHYEALLKSCNQLMESREELDELIRSSCDIHLLTDSAGLILQCNPAGEAFAPKRLLAGNSLQAFAQESWLSDWLKPARAEAGGALQDWVLPSHHDKYNELLSGATKGGSPPDQTVELQLQREATDTRPIAVSAQVLPVRKDGKVLYLHWILRDMTQLQETECAAQISSMVFKHAANSVLITDAAGKILAVNPTFSRITGYSEAEAVGRSPQLLRSGLQDGAFYADFWRTLRDTECWQGEIANRKKNGEIYREWLTVSAAHDDEGNIDSYIAVYFDLSRLPQVEKHLAYFAYHDSLTDLPNRRLLQDRLRQTLSQSRRSRQKFTLISIDLDHFKPINDTFGHAVGDSVLQEVAGRLAGAVRECDTIARVGGDEFVILAPKLCSDGDIGSFCDKLIEVLRQPIEVEGHELFIGGSFGCAEYPQHGDDETALLKYADAAMYNAKTLGGSTYVIHHPGGAWQLQAVAVRKP